MQTAKCTGELTSSKLLTKNSGYVSRIKVYTDGTNNATVILYDSTSASGKKIDKTVVTGASQYGGGIITVPTEFDNGLYFEISGTNAAAIIDYVEIVE